MACSKPLTTSDLSRVRNEVFSAAAKWYDIGLELGVSADDLDTIKKANDDPKDCLREMLRQWLSKEPYWEALIAALRKPAVNYSTIASEIEQKFYGAATESPVADDHHQTVSSPRFPLATPSTTSIDADLVLRADDLVNHPPAAASTPKPRQPVPKPHRSRTPTMDDPHQLGLIQSLSTSSDVSYKAGRDSGTCAPVDKEGIHIGDVSSLFRRGGSYSTGSSSPVSPVSSFSPPAYNIKTASYTNSLQQEFSAKGQIMKPRKSQQPREMVRKFEFEPLSDLEPVTPDTPAFNKMRKRYDKKQNYPLYNGSKLNFIKPPSDTLVCVQCGNLAYQPHKCCYCKKLFCKQCIFYNSECPVCFNPSNTEPEDRSDELIQSLLVWCPNSVGDGLGCNWIGELRDVSEHRNVCPREEVPCSYSVVGCEEKMQRDKLSKHEIEHRDAHLDLAMKKVVSLTTAFNELQERVKQLKGLQETVEHLLKIISVHEFERQSAIHD